MSFYPKENINILRSIENLSQVYLTEINCTSEFVDEDVVSIVCDMVEDHLRRAHEIKRNKTIVNIGDTLVFKTGSWQVREAGIEDKKVTIIGEELDTWNRLYYVLNSPETGIFWVSDKVLRAIKTNTIDKFVYVGTRCSDDMRILGF